MTIAIKSTDELETLTAAELASYEQTIKAHIAALKSAMWDVDMERWMRECPTRMAERDACNAELAERRAGPEGMTMPRLTIFAERATQAA
jgi:hypothetical protein